MYWKLNGLLLTLKKYFSLQYSFMDWTKNKAGTSYFLLFSKHFDAVFSCLVLLLRLSNNLSNQCVYMCFIFKMYDECACNRGPNRSVRDVSLCRFTVICCKMTCRINQYRIWPLWRLINSDYRQIEPSR